MGPCGRAGLGARVCSGPSSITGVAPTGSCAPGAGPAWACTMLSLGRALPVECLPSSTRKLPDSYALPSCLPAARVWGGWAEGPVSEPKGHSAGGCSPLQGVGVAVTGGWLSESWGSPEADGAFQGGSWAGSGAVPTWALGHPVTLPSLLPRLPACLCSHLAACFRLGLWAPSRASMSGPGLSAVLQAPPWPGVPILQVARPPRAANPVADLLVPPSHLALGGWLEPGHRSPYGGCTFMLPLGLRQSCRGVGLGLGCRCEG